MGGGLLLILLFLIPYGGILKLNFMFLFFFIGILYNKYNKLLEPYSNVITCISIIMFFCLAITGNAEYESKITPDYICNNPVKVTMSFLSGLSGYSCKLDKVISRIIYFCHILLFLLCHLAPNADVMVSSLLHTYKKRGASSVPGPRSKGSRTALLVEPSNAESPTPMYIP